MERLYTTNALVKRLVSAQRLVCILVLWSCWIASPDAGLAQDKCSLVVRVLTPDGIRPEAPISVTEKSGRTQEQQQEGGDVQFCDLGFLPVVVTVGSVGSCNQVTVKDVPVSLEDTYTLTVTYDPLACPESLPPPVPICRILFRVSDSGGKWIPGAHLTLTRPSRTELTADRFGRALFIARSGQEVSGSVSGSSFSPVNFSWTCSLGVAKDEHVVVVR